jgi:hypothetical protein
MLSQPISRVEASRRGDAWQRSLDLRVGHDEASPLDGTVEHHLGSALFSRSDTYRNTPSQRSQYGTAVRANSCRRGLAARENILQAIRPPDHAPWCRDYDPGELASMLSIVEREDRIDRDPTHQTCGAFATAASPSAPTRRARCVLRVARATAPESAPHRRDEVSQSARRPRS